MGYIQTWVDRFPDMKQQYALGWLAIYDLLREYSDE